METKIKGALPLILLGLGLDALFLGTRSWQEAHGIDWVTLLCGNTLLFLVSLISYVLALRGLKNPNAYAFVRSVYASILLKLFVCMIAAFIYISTHRQQVNKPALFSCMGLYLVYTFLEVAALMKRLRKTKHG